MSELLLPPELEREMAAVYAELARAYEVVASALGLSCSGCPDNCCDSWFFHYTYCEWAYLWQGLKQLDGATLAAIHARAEAYLDAARKAEAAGQRPRLLCPLNEGGLCRLYRHRLLICRSHGVPATLAGPDGRMRCFPGCFRCQELVAGSFGEPAQAPAMERTVLFRRLALVEQRLLGPDRRSYPRLRLTIADMIVQGPPQRQ